MSVAVERLAPVRVSSEPPNIEPLALPVDALAFVNDPTSAETLAALLGATGQGRVQFGGLNAALQVLQSAPCPNLLVVDISGLPDPLAHLDRLADTCPEGTAVVLVGNSDDPALVDELRTMGVVHYLIKPFHPEQMRAAILDAVNALSAPVYEPDQPRDPDPDSVPTALPHPAQPAGPARPPHQYMNPHDSFINPQDLAIPAQGTDPFSVPVQNDPTVPPPVTTQGGPLVPVPVAFAPVADIEPLPRPVDLLAFLTEAQSAAVVAAIIGPQSAPGRIQPGGINAAVNFLKDNASPKILMVDISGLTEPMSRVDALAEVCAPGTMVIATGGANDVTLYRNLKNAGIYEYLVKPIQPETLKNVVLDAASGGVREEPSSDKPILTVIGTRGGVGASTVAINFAGTIAKQDKKTILLDLDLQFGSVALTLDIDPGHGLREALESPERVDSMFLNSSAVKVAENLYVLAAEEGVNEQVAINAESLITLLHELQRHFDVIVIDMPRHVASGTWEAISRSHAVLLVADLSLVGIRDTTRMLAACKDTIDQAKVKLVISSTGGDRGAKIDRKEFETALNRKADYIMPDDAKSVSAANRAGRTVVDVAAGSKLAVALRELCDDLIGKPASEEQKKRSFSLFRRRPAT